MEDNCNEECGLSKPWGISMNQASLTPSLLIGMPILDITMHIDAMTYG